MTRMQTTPLEEDPLFGTRERPIITNDNAIHVSNNSLKQVVQCSTRAALYAFGYTNYEEAVAARAGVDAHSAREHYLKTGDAVAALKGFQESYEQFSIDNIPADSNLQRLTYDNTSRILATYFAKHPMQQGILYNEQGNALFQVQPDLVEVSFAEIPLAPDVYLRGIIDNFASDCNTGFFCVDDFKTTGQLTSWWFKQFIMDSQVTGYVFAGRASTSKPVVGAIISALEFSKLPLANPDRKCATHKVIYDECWPMHVKYMHSMVQRTEERLLSWQKTAVKVAYKYRELLKWVLIPERIALLPQEGTFHNVCTLCPYSEWCAADRPVKLLNKILKTQTPEQEQLQ